MTDAQVFYVVLAAILLTALTYAAVDRHLTRRRQQAVDASFTRHADEAMAVAMARAIAETETPTYYELLFAFEADGRAVVR